MSQEEKAFEVLGMAMLGMSWPERFFYRIASFLGLFR